MEISRRGGAGNPGKRDCLEISGRVNGDCTIQIDCVARVGVPRSPAQKRTAVFMSVFMFVFWGPGPKRVAWSWVGARGERPRSRAPGLPLGAPAPKERRYGGGARGERPRSKGPRFAFWGPGPKRAPLRVGGSRAEANVESGRRGDRVLMHGPR